MSNDDESGTEAGTTAVDALRARFQSPVPPEGGGHERIPKTVEMYVPPSVLVAVAERLAARDSSEIGTAEVNDLLLDYINPQFRWRAPEGDDAQVLLLAAARELAANVDE